MFVDSVADSVAVDSIDSFVVVVVAAAAFAVVHRLGQ